MLIQVDAHKNITYDVFNFISVVSVTLGPKLHARTATLDVFRRRSPLDQRDQ
jgi:hypothetical protein